MPTTTNSYVFFADFSSMANCLFDIQSMADVGAFVADAETLRLIKLLEQDALKKLYKSSLYVLANLEGVTITQSQLTGDFEDLDFEEQDFYTGYVDTSNNGFSSRFQTILNIFIRFKEDHNLIDLTDLQILTTLFVQLLDIFKALQDRLNLIGFNPCSSSPLAYNNSASLYLQGAGSPGTNGIPEGVLLRWSFAEELGSNHLPHGDYFNAGTNFSGYNQPNDYVYLSRTPYINTVSSALELAAALPAINSAKYEWAYIINTDTGGFKTTNIWRIKFVNQLRYRELTVTIDPADSPYTFLQSYKDQLQISIDNKSFFSFSYVLGASDNSGTGIMKIQANSGNLQGDQAGLVISARQNVNAGTGNQPVTGVISADNVVNIQLQLSGSALLESISAETYNDFFTSRNPSDWTTIGSPFALTTDDQSAFDRLENQSIQVDNNWPQYNGGTKVKVANYHDKWLTSRTNDPSLKASVQRYFTLSETDPRANDTISDEGAATGGPSINISYVDVLNTMACDFHLARMLGMGYIDTNIAQGQAQQYVYKMSYVNRKSLSNQQATNYQYLSLPTGTLDERLPPAPQLQELSYQLPGVTDIADHVFNELGYASNANARIVNIRRQNYTFENPDPEFWTIGSTQGDFNIAAKAYPIFYGIEYRKSTDTAYVKPEITFSESGHIYYAYDANFPSTGVPETVPVPDNVASLYVHIEKNEGIHAYALYSIDWFARASSLSDERLTDETQFPLIDRLQTPQNIAVQYIQKEDPLIFTTTTEQNWLAGREAHFAGKDFNFTRITFNWLDLTDISYLSDTTTIDFTKVVKASRVLARFKPELPLQLTGTIVGVGTINGFDNKLSVLAGNAFLIDGTVINNTVAFNDLGRFVGSLLVTPEGQFPLLSISLDGLALVFEIEKNIQKDTVTGTNNVFGVSKTFISPVAGSRFTITENLTQTTNWNNIDEYIQLVDFTSPGAPVIESKVDGEGNVYHDLIGGIWGRATIQQLYDTNDQSLMHGYYSVSFDQGIALNAHPQNILPFDPLNPYTNSPDSKRPPYVEWYNGQVRVPLAGPTDGKKVINAIRIVQTDPLVIYIYDPGYQDTPIRISADSNDWIDQVNFHPGYRAYLFSEPGPVGSFNSANILPQGSAKDKKTLLSLQSIDAGTGRSGLLSPLSAPAILLARFIKYPAKPLRPVIGNLKVRPDATGRAALTFDLPVNANVTSGIPFGFNFYRISNQDVLNALYTPATISQIYAVLAALTDDPGFNDRYLDLINLVFDPADTGHFKTYPATPQAYGFPLPDRNGLTAAGDSNEVKYQKYQAAINAQLLPLTAQIPAYELIKVGQQTENKLPVIKDVDEKLLDPADPQFDPYPMIRKYQTTGPTTPYIRFTDYTLYGSSRFLYFYAAAEVTDQLSIGPLSDFAGPVTILHTAAPEEPAIRKHALITGNNGISVAFYITPFEFGDPVSNIRIYRTLIQDHTSLLTLMESHLDVPLTIDTNNGIIAVDDFSDLSAPPVGETVYYRLAFIRRINNERNEMEDILGVGSETFDIRLLDTVNPPAPAITYSATSGTLSWPQTTNKGSYYLYQQNSRGNWQQISTIQPATPTTSIEYPIGVLNLNDSGGQRIYYRFKVKVQNSSGLFNLTDNELTV